MSPPYHRVILAGATGNLGPEVLSALVSASFEVTVLTRNADLTGLPAGVQFAHVDYESQESLVAALKGQDVFISNIPNHDAQPALIDACITAGVKRYIPSEFGSNVIGNGKTAALPVFAGKRKTEEYLREKSKEISWTVISTMAFLDWGLEKAFVVNLKGGESQIFDDGDAPHSMTTLQDAARAVVGVLNHPDETHNRGVYVQSTSVSQNKLLAIAKKVKPGFEPKVKQVRTEDLLKDSYTKLQAGGENVMPAMVGFLWVSAFSAEYGNNWPDNNDNSLLGIADMTEQELEELVKKYV